MSEAEMNKVLVVEKVVNHQLTIQEAANYLHLSTRQIKRLKKIYLEEGAKGFAHKNRGRKPVHAIPDQVKEKVVELYQQQYHGSNNCHFSELLVEREKITISPSSVRRILIAKGIRLIRTRRRSKAHKPRNRKTQAGMLWQIDASNHTWLEKRGPRMSLHAAIDDATGRVVGAVFRSTETREGYAAVMKQALNTYGVPLGLYSDRHNIFRSPNDKLTIGQELAGEMQPLSQFGRALNELKINHIKAMTPQAKGRIERLWGTFQDRLVIELRLLNICTLEEANAVLPELVAKHNAKFAVLPENHTSACRALPHDVDLDLVFAIREQRQIGPGQTISYNGKLFTTALHTAPRFELKALVEVRETLQGDVVIMHHGKAVALKETQKIQYEQPPEKKKTGTAQPRKPASSHPWKTTFDENTTKRTTNKSRFQDGMYSQHNSYAEGMW